ncbi:MAG: glycosyltransferase family 2 protein [Myxococcales bacterium]|nr:glycosyltransferase family 2 protein [Myxococcales bacterium]
MSTREILAPREPPPGGSPLRSLRSVSVMVPAFNEAESLEPVVREIAAVLAKLGRSHEIVIIDDGSSDGTGAIAERLAESVPSVRALHHAHNGGLGEVYRTGFRDARHELVTFLPADGQNPPSLLEQFLPLADRHDLVLGYVPNRDDSLAGRSLSALERQAYRILFGGFPRFQGVMVFRRALLDGMELRSTGRGWGIVMEFILRVVRAGHLVHSEPMALRARMSGTSKVNNLRTIWANAKQLLLIRLRL